MSADGPGEFRPVRYRRRGLDLRRSGGLAAFGGLTCVLFLDLASLTILPWWGVAILVALWLFLLLSAVAWYTPRPRRLLLLPVVGLAAWMLAVLLVVLTG